jgi:SAM-dependent methyltransferase
MARIPFVRALSTFLFGDPAHRLQRMIFREAVRAFGLEQSTFPAGIHLPPAFGVKLPERVVELVLARSTYVPGARVLDVGHSNIMECHRLLLNSLTPPKHFTGVDIAAPTYDVSRYYERSIIADITNTGLVADSFDRIWCISTLEHVGMDNTGYTGHFTLDEDLDVSALREMYRVLAPDGTLLITVPFGKSENHGWMKNYDLSAWHRLLDPFRRYADVYEHYFRYDRTAGWMQVEASRLAATGYYDNRNAGASGLAAVLVHKPVVERIAGERP